MVPNCVLHEFGVVSQVQMLHDAVFVKGDGAGREVKLGAHLFHGSPFRK
jgi:hypothetical protein